MTIKTVIFALFAFLTSAFAAPASAPAPAAPASNNDMALLEQESKFQKEKTEYIQQNILDKIMGPGKGVAFVKVEMGFEAKASEMGMGKSKSDKKKNEPGEDEKGPAPAPRVLVPGVPMPKSVTALEEDRGGESKESGGQMQQRRMEVRTTIKKLEVNVLYDKRVAQDKLLASKEAIMAVLKVAENQMVFTPTTFSQTEWEQVLTPKWLIPLFLLLWLLLFLWGPLRSFFKRLNAALEDKRQLIEQTQKIEQEEESEEQAEEEGDQEGDGGAGEGEGELTEEELLAEEEAMKKFEPFTYVGENNLKGLAYLLRKEEPWIIALVLSYLKPEYSKGIFTSMPPELQARVAVEAATIRQTSLEQVMSIDEYVKKKVDYVLGGVENLIKILNESDKNTRENILEYLRNEKPSLYERVREEVILFEDIVQFPDAAIQGIVREVGTEQLSRALRGAPSEFMNKFFTNMSGGAAALLKESMDYGRPLTPEQIDEERKNLIDLIGRLEKEQKITIRKKRKAGILDGEEAADDTEGLQTSLAKTTPPKTTQPPSDPIKAQEHFQNGAALYEQGQLPEAVQEFHTAIQNQNDFWQAYQYLGAAYTAQGMIPQAAGAYERMLEINPDESLRVWVMQWKASMGLSSQAEAV